MMTAPAYRAHPIRNFFRNEGNRWRRHPASALLRLLCRLSVLITIFALLAIVIDLLVKGIPHLTPELFSLKYTTENQSMLPAIINTLLIALVALLVAIPIGVGGAIYLAEYAKRNSPLVRTIRLTAETLQGIPSIIYGLFGMVFFTALRINLTLLSGALTLSLMVLPLILRTTEEALLSIPDSYREGSFGLGAGKLRTVIKIVLPPAMPGILSGVVLAMAASWVKPPRCCLPPARSRTCPSIFFSRPGARWRCICISCRWRGCITTKRTPRAWCCCCSCWG